MNFAPVIDINVNPDNPVINTPSDITISEGSMDNSIIWIVEYGVLLGLIMIRVNL